MQQGPRSQIAALAVFRCREIETVRFHDLGPCGDEVAHEGGFRTVVGVHSAMARSSALEPNTRSTSVAVHFISPVARSRPSKTYSLSCDGRQTVFMSSRLTKKSLSSASVWSVNTP
jgi:hypothetical protein